MFGRVVSLGGVAAILGALLSLAMPVHLGFVDRAGAPIPCGNGFHSRVDVAREQDRLNFAQYTTGGPMFVASNYVQQCQSTLSDRRSTALPVGAGGAVVLIAAIGLRRSCGVRRRQHPAVGSALTQPDTREAAVL